MAVDTSGSLVGDGHYKVWFVLRHLFVLIHFSVSEGVWENEYGNNLRYVTCHSA